MLRLRRHGLGVEFTDESYYDQGPLVTKEPATEDAAPMTFEPQEVSLPAPIASTAPATTAWGRVATAPAIVAPYATGYPAMAATSTGVPSWVGVGIGLVVVGGIILAVLKK